MSENQTSPLAPRYRSLLVLHGAGAALAGMLGGMAFLFNILRFIEIFPFVPKIDKKIPGTEPAWRAAHTGPIMNGMLAMGVGAAGPMIKLSPAAQRGLVGTLLVTIWGNTVGYNAAAMGGQRGLTPRGRPLNNLAYVCFLVAALSVLVSISLVILGVRRHRRDEPTPAET